MRLFRCPHRIFITSLRWPRDTVEMQGIELVAIFSLLSSLFSLFSAPSSLLSSALDSRNRIPAFLQGIMRPRGVLHCKNEAIRGGPGANKPCCQSIWGSLAAFFVISSLFSLLSSLFSLLSTFRNLKFAGPTAHGCVRSPVTPWGHRRNVGIRACGYFGAPIGFS